MPYSEGRGKGSKGLGKGGAKRHRKVDIILGLYRIKKRNKDYFLIRFEDFS